MDNLADTIQTGERLSFSQIFTKKGFSVEIPIIQRDYAQGRETSEEVRSIFLQALFDYLDQGIPNRDLDFVYGTLDDSTTRFIPLDGQQRLTTLFLLHWYLANLSGNSSSFKAALLDGELKSKFSYETRSSSREFCDSLTEANINFSSLLDSETKSENSLSATIRNFGWYQFSWDLDPTVKSMLQMLDSIHLLFQNRPDFYPLLMSDEKPIITFLFLNLKKFKLTDDLYIKMNSRGVPLTPFENFKAKFEQHLNTFENEMPRNFQLTFDGEERTVKRKEYFSFSIETRWSDLFWNYRSVGTKDDTFDSELMNFIRVILSFNYGLTIKLDTDENLEYLIGTYIAKKRKDYSDNISFYRYQNLNALTSDGIDFLIDSFDCFYNGEKPIFNHLEDQFYFNENDHFEKAITHSLTLTQRVRFFAYTKFLIENRTDRSGIHQWMRVIFNLTENTAIDGTEQFVRAIKSVQILLKYSSNILEYLASGNSEIQGFYGPQILEEQIKAILILRGDNWKKAIEDAEKHPFFLGQIGFLFEFTGLLKSIEVNRKFDWSSEEGEDSAFESFTFYSQRAASAFSFLTSPENEDFLWERSVLTKGKYFILGTQNRQNMLNGNRTDRDVSWKRFLRLNPKTTTNSLEQDILFDRRNFVKQVLDDSRFNTKSPNLGLDLICKDVREDWTQLLIANPLLMKYSKQGYIQYKSEKEVLLYNASQSNHLHTELFTYDFFTEYSDRLELEPPFGKFGYEDIKGSEYESFIYLTDWKYERKEFDINIWINPDSDGFLIGLVKKKGDKKRSEYPDKLVDVMDELSMLWDFDNGFWIPKRTKKSTYDFIKKLCQKLSSL